MDTYDRARLFGAASLSSGLCASMNPLFPPCLRFVLAFPLRCPDFGSINKWLSPIAFLCRRAFPTAATGLLFLQQKPEKEGVSLSPLFSHLQLHLEVLFFLSFAFSLDWWLGKSPFPSESYHRAPPSFFLLLQFFSRACCCPVFLAVDVDLYFPKPPRPFHVAGEIVSSP